MALRKKGGYPHTPFGAGADACGRLMSTWSKIFHADACAACATRGGGGAGPLRHIHRLLVEKRGKGPGGGGGCHKE